jgi:hypothetical protein
MITMWSIAMKNVGTSYHGRADSWAYPYRNGLVARFALMGSGKHGWSRSTPTILTLCAYFNVLGARPVVIHGTTTFIITVLTVLGPGVDETTAGVRISGHNHPFWDSKHFSTCGCPTVRISRDLTIWYSSEDMKLEGHGFVKV